MQLASLTLQGFRCFGAAPVTLAFDPLTTFVGANGTGKSAVLMALVRMFGVTAASRTLTKSDFHLPVGVGDPDELSLLLDARFTFPELLDSAAAQASTAVPECLRHILADDSRGAPECRIRLRATWRKSLSIEGDIEQKLEWVNTLADDVPVDAAYPLNGHERSQIQVFYVPAVRDASRELRVVSGSILSRALRLIPWSDETKTELASLGAKMSSVLKSEESLGALEVALGEHWSDLRGTGFGVPELALAEADLAGLLRHLDAKLLRPGSVGQPLHLLSDGEQSLLYFALVATALQFEASHADAAGSGVPALTIVAVEEPENHLAPQYLSRILATLRTVHKHRNAQVVLSSHSSSILRRVSPNEIRHFRTDPAAGPKIGRIVLPPSADESFKYVREAVQAHPEVYFASVVTLCEGASEEVVLPRIARALGLDIDPRFIAVVPLGGRHVAHMWRLLDDLGTPYVTLLDLDRERFGGGWGRIREVCNQLLVRGHERSKVLDGISDAEFAAMSTWPPSSTDMEEWTSVFESEFNVFFSSPMDIDLMMLSAYTSTYQALAPESGGPRVPTDAAALAARLDRVVTAVLGPEGGDGSSYLTSERDLFIWYAYFFVGGSKPTTHSRALAELDDNVIKAQCPPLLVRLMDRVRALASTS